ncbi:1-hydroxycarotenoid 3,4-desaturase CrtD [Methylocapsa palsarum]|uniref:1-hydroxycarotenoid 3,4-desaturase n=1 Tax=Methylocapsa palsarum TaxID=1612308 RepID=A0A1I4BBX0_9HYPH|nr:1-hydroxycarotenoid 3,4-desaturase CrtD [Methylocapsa palsarum]SFK66298.1 1-hydroxycarotenoid 3,4-desaturase [Methylocapsa palsarum]
MLSRTRVVVIGAGVGGLAAASDLAAQGLDVLVIDKALAPGGKMRQVSAGGAQIDAGPTVLTMRWVFEELFAAAGQALNDHVTLRPLDILARHAWSDQERLDLFSSIARTQEAIGAFAGAAEARRYGAFCAEARRIYEALEQPFIRSSSTNPIGLVARCGLSGIGGLSRINPFTTMWGRLSQHFQDRRLRQLFGRYATYCGSSPFLAPATLMLVAHVEREGVWIVEGGMHKIAAALAEMASRRGVSFQYGRRAEEIIVSGGRVAGLRLADGDLIEAGAVVVNADVNALAGGHFGEGVRTAAAGAPCPARSLSAVTWAICAKPEGFPLVRHNVFFSTDYEAEFDDIFRRKLLPSEPTVYVCAQDRADGGPSGPRREERLLCLVNAPPTGDSHTFTRAEIEQCEKRAFGRLERCGLVVRMRPEMSVVTDPNEFERLFPATGGALYGRASHGWRASFQRPGARTRIPGLYLAGGSTHPGPGVPMAALSGRTAAASLLADLASTRRFHPAATPGGMSTR